MGGSLLIEMAAVLKLNILLGFFGMQLVKIDEEPLASSPQKDKSGINLDEDEGEEEDPDYVPEDTADDSLEYRSDTEATQESQDVVEALRKRRRRNQMGVWVTNLCPRSSRFKRSVILLLVRSRSTNLPRWRLSRLK